MSRFQNGQCSLCGFIAHPGPCVIAFPLSHRELSLLADVFDGGRTELSKDLAYRCRIWRARAIDQGWARARLSLTDQELFFISFAFLRSKSPRLRDVAIRADAYRLRLLDRVTEVA